MPRAPTKSSTYASFRWRLKGWSSGYHATRLEHDPVLWADEQAWDDVRPSEWPEMVVAAAAIGCEPLLRQLLDRGGSPTAPNAKGIQPVFAAARVSSQPSLELLVNRGASLDAQEANGVGVFHAALKPDSTSPWNGHYADTVLWLLKKGQSPLTPDDDGNTPLHYAASTLNESVHAALVSAGADWSARNREGVFPAQTLFEIHGKEDSPFFLPQWREHLTDLYNAALAHLHASDLTQELPGSEKPVSPRAPRL